MGFGCIETSVVYCTYQNDYNASVSCSEITSSNHVFMQVVMEFLIDFHAELTMVVPLGFCIYKLCIWTETKLNDNWLEFKILY